MFEKVKSVLAQQFELDPEFGIAISDNDAAQLYTVGRIVDYLEKLQ